MKVPAPHFLLFSQARGEPQGTGCGQWRFVLEAADGSTRIEAADEEPAAGERLELLATVRGLEALDQPSRVTLVTGSRYVSRGIRFGLTQWRESGWHWERYGEMAPIRDSDLWRRIDTALRFHDVECKSPRRLDTSDDLAPPLRLVGDPPARAPDEAEEPREVPVVHRRRQHRGRSLRFDAGKSSLPPRRMRQQAPWLARLFHWLIGSRK